MSDAAEGRDCVRVAAAGDIHLREANAEQVKGAFQAIAGGGGPDPARR